MKNIKAGTLVRTVCLMLVLINYVLTSMGKSPLPIKDETIALMVSTVTTVITSVVAWWKNNSFTPAAIEADEIMKSKKEDGT